MRMMMKATLPVETANKAIKDGTLPKIMQSVADECRPEATYFTTLNGKRTALFFFDMKDSSQMPVIAEQLFMALNADIEFHPAMNPEDLSRGLEAFGRKHR